MAHARGGKGGARGGHCVGLTHRTYSRVTLPFLPSRGSSATVMEWLWSRPRTTASLASSAAGGATTTSRPADAVLAPAAAPATAASRWLQMPSPFAAADATATTACSTKTLVTACMTGRGCGFGGGATQRRWLWLSWDAGNSLPRCQHHAPPRCTARGGGQHSGQCFAAEMRLVYVISDRRPSANTRRDHDLSRVAFRPATFTLHVVFLFCGFLCGQSIRYRFCK